MHFFCNIKESAAAPEIQSLMQSLTCSAHADFDGTITKIAESGKIGTGKHSSVPFQHSFLETSPKHLTDWVDNKIRCKFSFASICNEKSLIPLNVWCAGNSNDNINESGHQDIYIEGKGHTLVRALILGMEYNNQKNQARLAQQQLGIHSSYRSKEDSEQFQVGLQCSGKITVV